MRAWLTERVTAESVDLTHDVLPNLRDLGDLSAPGGRTRSGVLLRSAAPLAGDRVPELSSWPPATVLDLRGSDELAGRPHPLIGPATSVHALPLMDESVHRDTGTDWSAIPDLSTAYQSMLRTGGAKLAAIVELVATAEAPVLVHCAAGKDRTGVVVALLLRAAGVPRDEVLRDYQLTEPHMTAVFARTPALATAADPTHLQRLLGVPVEAMDAVLDVLDDAPGGVPGWLAARGVREATVTAWRARLLG
jgi:hypothetical protein